MSARLNLPLAQSFADPALALSGRRILEAALTEDLGAGDVTASAIVDRECRARARIHARQDVRVAGIPLWVEAMRLCAPADTVEVRAVPDGTVVRAGSVLAEAEAPARLLLGSERVAMNLLCHLCGISTMTAEWVEAAGTLRVLDTRKTTPGLRALEKYAVRVGGGHNHRMGLDGGVLIKENHIAAAGTLEDALERACAAAPHTLYVQCEVRTSAEAVRAVRAGADALLLDNMSDREIKGCLDAIGDLDSVFVEASGGMDLERVASLSALADRGLDAISAGALTHSRPYADLSMLMEIYR
jgi:nicotinate-nucleotide pyrophosphorylase (carboxylating)